MTMIDDKTGVNGKEKGLRKGVIKDRVKRLKTLIMCDMLKDHYHTSPLSMPAIFASFSSCRVLWKKATLFEVQTMQMCYVVCCVLEGTRYIEVQMLTEGKGVSPNLPMWRPNTRTNHSSPLWSIFLGKSPPVNVLENMCLKIMLSENTIPKNTFSESTL